MPPYCTTPDIHHLLVNASFSALKRCVGSTTYFDIAVFSLGQCKLFTFSSMASFVKTSQTYLFQYIE